MNVTTPTAMQAGPAGPTRLPRLPRLGFLGTGWIGRNRLQALVASGAGEVAAIADSSADRAQEAHALAPHASIAGSLDELLGTDLDGIVIATPSALHAEQAIRSLDHGLAVFCQKPLARTTAENRGVLDAALRADRLLGIDLSYRYTTAMQRVREAVVSGTTGEVFSVDLVFHNAYGPDSGWARDPALSGGGCVMDLGIHMIDLALWVLDYPAVARVDSQLYCRGRRRDSGSAECEDHALATIELDTGAAIRLACSWEAQTGRDAVIEATFHGASATAAMHNVDGSFYDFRAVLCTGSNARELAAPPDGWGGRALVEWSRRLGRGDGFDPAVETILDVAATLDAVLGR
jgi:predicted dehydrogenase